MHLEEKVRVMEEGAGIGELLRVDSSAAASMGAVVEGRRELARYWLEISAEEAREEFAGELGHYHQGMLACGVREHNPSAEDEELREEILSRLGETPPKAGAILAAMLMFFPHQLPFLWRLEQVPDWLVDAYLDYTLKLPCVCRSPNEPDMLASYLEAQLGYLREAAAAEGIPARRERILDRIAALRLIPAYFARGNLRQVMSHRGKMLEQWLTATGHKLDCELPPRPQRSRIRMGVLALGYGAETETFASLPLYRHLDRRDFEVILLSPTLRGSAMERFCGELADRFVALPGDISAQVEAIRKLNLDILLVTTNLTAVANPITMMAAHRLARVQIAAVNSCVTTGLKNIDWHLSGTLVEPGENAQEHYTERLLQIEGTGHCYDFGCEPAGAQGAAPAREDLGIKAGETVFVCGANAWKIVPDVEEVWARVLAAVPGSRLLLHPDNPNWTYGFPFDAWIARAERTFEIHGVSADRLLLFRRTATRQEVLRRMQIGDVYLDSFPFSGATTLLDGLLAGLVPVVMEGCNFRSLMGAAVLREMKMPELIARNAEQYVELAVKLATDSSFRAGAKERISAAMRASPSFLDAQDYARKIRGALVRAWEAR